jgi:methyltransferase (TIGR00027 family)
LSSLAHIISKTANGLPAAGLPAPCVTAHNRFRAFVTNRASVTAEYMALFRLLESTRPSRSRLLFDPDGALFLTGGRKWMARVAGLPGGRRLAEWLLDRVSPGARAAGIARTKWIDDEATAALKTTTQLVLLGAGFDLRALRLPQAAQALTFELDHPQTSSAKQAALRSIQSTLPEHVRYIGIDFNCQSITETLLNAGFDTSRPACWIWEGVTNYLTAEAVDGALRQIADTSAEGSILLFTYVERAVLDDPSRYYGALRLTDRLKSYGEPWTFGLEPRDVRSYLAARRFELLKDVSVAEVWKYAGRSELGTHGYEFYRIASARVGG